MQFREFMTTSGTQILAGKSDANNDQLVSQVQPQELVFHTVQPGSPFVVIKGKTTKEAKIYALVICAAYSQDWKQHKKDVKVHNFLGNKISKGSITKAGSFHVSHAQATVVKKEQILSFQKQLKRKEAFLEQLQVFKKMNLPQEEYTLIGDAPLAIRGIRLEKQISVLCSDELYTTLLHRYKQAGKSFTRKGITFTKATTPQEEKDITTSEQIEGFSFRKVPLKEREALHETWLKK